MHGMGGALSQDLVSSVGSLLVEPGMKTKFSTHVGNCLCDVDSIVGLLTSSVFRIREQLLYSLTYILVIV